MALNRFTLSKVSDAGTNTGPIRSGPAVVILSDGTLLMHTYWGSTSTLEIHYSTDGGASWTGCSTKVSGFYHSGYPAPAMAVDQNDHIHFLGYKTASSYFQVESYTFSGTDITLQHTSSNISNGLFNPTILAFDCTNRADDSYIVVSGNNSTSRYIYYLTYDMATGYSSATNMEAIGYVANQFTDLTLWCTADRHNEPATSDPIVYWLQTDSSYNLRLRAFELRASSTGSSSSWVATSSGWTATYTGLTMAYDPTLNKVGIIHEGVGSDLYFNSFTPEANIATTPTMDGEVTLDWGAVYGDDWYYGCLTTDGLGTWAVLGGGEDDVAATEPAKELVFNGTTWDAATEIPMAVELSQQAMSRGDYGWNANGQRFQAATILEDGSADMWLLMYYSEGGGAFVGWGIPMGIA